MTGNNTTRTIVAAAFVAALVPNGSTMPVSGQPEMVYEQTIGYYAYWSGTGFDTAAGGQVACSAAGFAGLCPRAAVEAAAPDGLCSSGWTADAGRGWFASPAEARAGCGTPGQWNTWAHPSGQGSAHCCSVTSATAPEPPGHPVGLVVPLYVYPTAAAIEGIYTAVAAAASERLSVTVIVNPDNGNGATCPPPAPWADALAVLAEHGGEHLTVIGYVHSNWGKRPRAEYASAIDAYAECWGAAGVFVDEAATEPRLAAGYYAEVHRQVKQWPTPGTVWLNPGVGTDAAYMGVSDVVVQFEDHFAEFAGNRPPAYLPRFAPERTAMMVLDAPDAESMRQVVAEAAARGAGWITVLDSTSSYTSPFLPSFWPELVALLQATAAE